jgi:hypothetical protein
MFACKHKVCLLEFKVIYSLLLLERYKPMQTIYILCAGSNSVVGHLDV